MYFFNMLHNQNKRLNRFLKNIDKLCYRKYNNVVVIIKNVNKYGNVDYSVYQRNDSHMFVNPKKNKSHCT